MAIDGRARSASETTVLVVGTRVVPPPDLLQRIRSSGLGVAGVFAFPEAPGAPSVADAALLYFDGSLADGTSALAALRRACPRMPVVVLDTSPDQSRTGALLGSGAADVRDARSTDASLLRFAVDAVLARREAAAVASGDDVHVESERMFRQMADAAPMLVWLVDREGHCTYVNERWHQLTGQDRKLARGRGWRSAVHPEDRPHVLETLREALRTHEDFTAEMRLCAVDGTERRLLCAGVPRFGPDGEFAGLLGSCVDITEHQRAQAALREVEKLAATSRMAARIAHEINNPLAGIQNSFLLIKDAVPVSHPHHDFVGRIERELARVNNIVRQMFDLHLGDREADSACNVTEAICDVVALLRASSNAQGVSLRCRCPSEDLLVPVIRGGVLRQVLFNLTQNAVEASPCGGVVALDTLVSDDHIEITVSDQGQGIPDVLREKIFEPFFSTKEHLARAGLGLGLATARSLVDATGGTLTFESKPGEGTVFRLWMPWRRAEEQPQ